MLKAIPAHLNYRVSTAYQYDVPSLVRSRDIEWFQYISEM